VHSVKSNPGSLDASHYTTDRALLGPVRSSASRTTRTSQTSGPISSSSGLMGRRN